MHRPPLWAEILVTITLPTARNECQWSVNNFWSCILDNLRAMERRYPIINLSAALMGKNPSDDIASASCNWAPTERQQSRWRLSKLHGNELDHIVVGLCHMRSVFSTCPRIHLHKYACIVSPIWFFACSCRVNIYEPSVCCAVSLLSAVFRIGLPSILIPNAMRDSKSLNPSFLVVMISSEDERVFFRDLSDLTLQIIFDAWWASMNLHLKQPIAWNNSGHVPVWWLYLHCGIEETGSPGIICIVCHQVLRHPSEHGTSSMGKHLLATAHIPKLNELTESEVTELTSWTVDETAVSILKRQGSWGITIVRSQRRIISDIPVHQCWPKWQNKRSKLAAKDFETSDCPQDAWNRYLMFGFVSAHSPWNAISYRERWRTYTALRDDLVLPSATTLSNICRRQYALTVGPIRKQLPSQNTVSSALDGWTPPNTLAITSVIAYYMDWNWALLEVHHAFHEIDHLFFSDFKS